jgi:ubiquinone/menaquinone biosynthesis C-methylase UbiE
VGEAQAVLDVGCGLGTDTVPLATIVGPRGRVAGIDQDACMVSEATRRAEAAGVAGWVTHRQADANALPFQAETFDACRSERLFQHLSQPELALQEMVRVTRHGGRVVVLDTDWGTRSTDALDVDLERRLARACAEVCLPNGYAGRQLYRLFKEQQLQEVEIEILPFMTTSYALARFIGRDDVVEAAALARGLATAVEIQRLRASLEQADAAGTFIGYVCIVMVAGTKIRPTCAR